MSRTVESIGENVVFFDASDFNGDCCDWHDLISSIQYGLCKKYSSFNIVKKFVPYPYRENRIILENDFVSMSISEYCGCSAISVFVRQTQMGTLYTDYPDLAEHWLDQCFPGIKKIVRQYVKSMVKIGTFSNGEAVYKLEN